MSRHTPRQLRLVDGTGVVHQLAEPSAPFELLRFDGRTFVQAEVQPNAQSVLLFREAVVLELPIP